MAPSRRDVIVAVPDAVEAAEIFRRFVDLLWSERELLELVLFKLVAQHAILLSGEFTRHPPWLSRADDEVRAALRRLQDAEIVRATETDAVSRRYGLGPDVTLLGIAGVAPQPWSEILHDHHDELSGLSREVDDVAGRIGDIVRECEAAMGGRETASASRTDIAETAGAMTRQAEPSQRTVS